MRQRCIGGTAQAVDDVAVILALIIAQLARYDGAGDSNRSDSADRAC